MIHSEPYHPKDCCEKCIFGSGEHAAWCRYAIVRVPRKRSMTQTATAETPKDRIGWAGAPPTGNL